MSRIGIKPIAISSQVTVEMTGEQTTVTGPRGKLAVALPHGITLDHKNDQLVVGRISDVKLYKALHGTVRNLLQNAVTGVTTGFEKKCEVVGIGYRVAVEGSDLVLQVGYTHPVRLAIPEGLTAKVEKNLITIAGNDKQVVGQFAAIVRAVRPPDRYKGKGIRYQGELVKLKQGKATKAGS
jgi:large subunit ribosomal protein L6